MTVEERMTAMEAAYGTQSDLMRELRDAVTVGAQLEAQHSRITKDHGHWLAAHDRELSQHAERMKELDLRIANLVTGIGEFMRRDRELN